MRDSAWLKVAGRRFDRHKSYSLQQDITVPSAGFRFETTALGKVAELRELLSDGVSVEIGVDLEHQGRVLPVTQMSGMLTARSIDVDRGGGTVVSLEGLDHSAHLTKNSADLEWKKGESFADLAKRVCEPHGIEVTHDAKSARDIQTGRVRLTSAQQRLLEQARYTAIPRSKLRRKMLQDADKAAQGIDVFAGVPVSDAIAAEAAGGLTPADLRRLSVKEAKAEYAETQWQFLARHAERLGIFMRMGPAGRKLILSVPDYTQPPSYELRRDKRGGGNILSGGESLNSDTRYTTVRVYGTVKASEDAPRRKQHSTVFDNQDPLPFERVLAIHDQEATTADQLYRRALREMAKSKAGFKTYRYTVQGHGQNGIAYAPDTVTSIHDDAIGVRDRFYVRSRELQRDQRGGTVTTLTCVPLYSIVP